MPGTNETDSLRSHVIAGSCNEHGNYHNQLQVVRGKGRCAVNPRPDFLDAVAHKMDIEHSAFEKLRDCVSTLKLLHGRTDRLDTENSSVGQITNKTPGGLANVGAHIKDDAQNLAFPPSAERHTAKTDPAERSG